MQCWLDEDNAHPIPHHQLAGIKLHTEEKKLSNLDISNAEAAKACFNDFYELSFMNPKPLEFRLFARLQWHSCQYHKVAHMFATLPGFRETVLRRDFRPLQLRGYRV